MKSARRLLRSRRPRAQTFTGTITDDMCAEGGHTQMRMGPTDAECTNACVSAHDAKYVLYDGKDVYTLSDQKTPEKFAAQKVTVAARWTPRPGRSGWTR